MSSGDALGFLDVGPRALAGLAANLGANPWHNENISRINKKQNAAAVGQSGIN